MKKVTLFSLISILSILCFIACRKNEDEPIIIDGVDNHWGVGTAIKGNLAWSAKMRAVPDADDSTKIEIILDNYLNDIRKEGITVSHIPKKVGTYPIVDQSQVKGVKAVLYTISNEGDVLEDTYFGIENAANFISIDSIKSNKEIKGKFNVTFFIQQPKWNKNNLDTLIFTDGIFHAKIE